MNDIAPLGPPSVGDAAPPLVLPDDTGTVLDLADQRGRWVVLFFYPKDFTSGCTTEACEFRDSAAAFADLNATIWGISVLDSDSKAAFKAKHGLNYPLLADQDHAVSERYGVWVEKNNYGKKSMGIVRSTFLVEPDGQIAELWSKVRVEGHAGNVLAAVEASAGST